MLTLLISGVALVHYRLALTVAIQRRVATVMEEDRVVIAVIVLNVNVTDNVVRMYATHVSVISLQFRMDVTART